MRSYPDLPELLQVWKETKSGQVLSPEIVAALGLIYTWTLLLPHQAEQWLHHRALRSFTAPLVTLQGLFTHRLFFLINRESQEGREEGLVLTAALPSPCCMPGWAQCLTPVAPFNPYDSPGR